MLVKLNAGGGAHNDATVITRKMLLTLRIISELGYKPKTLQLWVDYHRAKLSVDVPPGSGILTPKRYATGDNSRPTKRLAVCGLVKTCFLAWRVI